MLLNLTLNVEITQARKDKESARALPVLSHSHWVHPEAQPLTERSMSSCI